jgi:hypothetical protein
MNRRDLPRGLGALALIAGLNLMNAVSYFVAFLFAYGFKDRVTTGQHVFFFGCAAVIILVSARISVSAVGGALGVRAPKAFATWATVALNLVVLGAGSIVSATHKDENSVSADFSTTTDVVIAVALLAPAVVAAWLTWRSWPRQGVLTG